MTDNKHKTIGLGNRGDDRDDGGFRQSVSKDDTEVLAHLDETLKRVVYGQDKAVNALTTAIKLARAGLRDPEKPSVCCSSAGPTGVGGTEEPRNSSPSLSASFVSI